MSLKASDSMQKSVVAYTKAKAIRQEAVRTIFDEIASMLKDAGLDAEVIIRGSNAFNTLNIEIRLPDDGSTLLVDQASSSQVAE